MKCPKCGSSKGRETLNSRSKQQVWHCADCGKLVNLGKAKKEPQRVESAQAGKTEKASQPKAPRRKTASAAHRTTDDGDGRPSGSLSTGRDSQVRPARIGKLLREFFDI